MDKTAVDQAAVKYWEQYFSEYGEMWVRDIPRRIKSAMTRSAELKAKSVNGILKPLAKKRAEDGTLSIEAAFTGKIDDKIAKVLVTTSFDKAGKMLQFEAHQVA